MDTRITRVPGVCGGDPCIRGTRICVRHIKNWEKLGFSVDQILQNFPFLTLEDVTEALAFELTEDEASGD